MPVTIGPSTLPGGRTPVCGDCGIHLCWDISEVDYQAHSEFWDQWKCEDCNGGVRMRKPEAVWPTSRLDRRAAGG